MRTDDLLKEEFDIFIAYHGTDDPNGSLEKAREIYELLSSRAKCFFNPVTNPAGSFSDTPTVAKHSKLFLLVANGSIALNDKNEITSAGLFREIDAFYKAHFNEIGNRGNARVYAYGGLSARTADGVHVAFGGSAHFSQDENGNALKNLVDWVDSALNGKSSASFDNEYVFQSHSGAVQPRHYPYEGIWCLTGDFKQFQGDARNKYISTGRLILTRNANNYKAIYCYSVSREFADQSNVTAICEGNSSFAKSETGTEQLKITCDIIGRTVIKKQKMSSRHFTLTLTPVYNDDGTIDSMTADFKTRNTDGLLTFTRLN